MPKYNDPHGLNRAVNWFGLGLLFILIVKLLSFLYD